MTLWTGVYVRFKEDIPPRVYTHEPVHPMAKKKDEAATSESQPQKLTQRQAVEKALAAGKDSPTLGVPYIKEQFGITLNNGAFSTIKSQLKKASGAAPSGLGRKPGRPVTRTGSGVITGNGRAQSPAELARQVKTLIEAYGVAAVEDMVAVFAD
jgi:hypothetical protein